VEQERVFSVPSDAEVVVKIGSITEGWFLARDKLVVM
jgi:hypothetical protein